MHSIEINELWTLLAALLTIMLGTAVIARLPLLARYSIPPAVVGSFLVAVALLVVEQSGWQLRFGSRARGVLLLIFFTTLGLTARLRALRGGGLAVALMSLAIALLALAQNAVGAAVAWAFGEPASLAVFLGSAAFLGGHGTTAAWAGQPLAASAANAFEVGMACATLGLVAGGVLGSVVATRLLKRVAVAPDAGTAVAPVQGEVALHTDADERPFGFWTSSDRWLRQMLVLSATIGIALGWQAWLAGRGVNVPPFLACLLSAVVFTNLADLFKHGVDLETADLVGTVALRLFLAMSLMSLDLGAVFRAAGLILSAVVLQCGVTLLIAVTLVRYAAARGATGAQAARDGAVAAPRAFLVVTLAASPVQDLINAGAVQATLSWAAP